ncbi:hypothetical protein NPIL_118771 [Nephila pilipes]|uniref:Uncharacterized protein n=1 Tax=Nephila pilipes TaxID=299642 RepID=A0A8X6N3Y5_NEPPI|nr:hypothetical protein NPIL_118771 [Nephila pilipes]
MTSIFYITLGARPAHDECKLKTSVWCQHKKMLPSRCRIGIPLKRCFSCVVVEVSTLGASVFAATLREDDTMITMLTEREAAGVIALLVRTIVSKF